MSGVKRMKFDLQKLFKNYKPDNEVDLIKYRLDQKTENVSLFSICSIVFVFCAAGFLGLLASVFLLTTVVCTTMVLMMMIKEDRRKHYEEDEKLPNKEIIENVEYLLVKNIKTEISKTIDKRKIEKCEVYLIAIYATQRFLIDEAEKQEGEKDFFESKNIELINLLNDQKLAIQRFMDNYMKTGYFDDKYLIAVKNELQKKAFILTPPSSVVLNSYHIDELEKLGVLEQELNAYGLIKAKQLPKMVKNKKGIIVSASSCEIKEKNDFSKIDDLIGVIEKDYMDMLNAKSKLDFEHIKNERYPEIIAFYKKIEKLTDKKLFIEDLQKAIINIQEDLNEIIALTQSNLLKEIKVINHTSKMRHSVG